MAKVTFKTDDAVVLSGKVASVNEEDGSINVVLIDNEGNDLHTVTVKPNELRKA